MRIVFGTDHAGFALREAVIDELTQLGHEVIDVGTKTTDSVDFPDYADKVGRVLQEGEAERGVLLCGSGVGVAIAANKIRGVRASIIHDTYSAHQGVEHDGLNVLCMGGRIIGEALAREIVRTFTAAEFQEEERFIRRVNKINALETRELT